VGEDNERRLPQKRSRRRQGTVESSGAGVGGELLTARPVVAGQLSLFDAKGCPDLGRGEVEDRKVPYLGSTDAGTDLEGRDLVQAPVAEEFGNIEQAGPGPGLPPDRPDEAARRQPSGRVRRVRQR
jgi:hypothetical protein